MGLSLYPDIKGSIGGMETHHISHEKEVQDYAICGKALLMAFCNAHDILLLELLDRRVTVNADHYCTAVRYLNETS
jgi:hypothetical protein